MMSMLCDIHVVVYNEKAEHSVNINNPTAGRLPTGLERMV